MKPATSILLAALLILAPVVQATTAYPLKPTDEPIVKAIAYFREIQLPDGDIGYSYMVAAWVTIALAAAGIDPHTVRVESTLNSVVDYLLVQDVRLKSNQARATDWERVILALAAAGENPRTFAGTDHIAGLLAYWDGRQFGSPAALNDDFFAILALRSAGFPTDSPYLQGSMRHILANQNVDGGWSYSVGVQSDSDDTAAAMMALVAAGYGPGTAMVDSASLQPSTCLEDAIACAVAYLDMIQNPDGGFPYHLVDGTTATTSASPEFNEDGAESTSNTASDAWVIQALAAVGEDPVGPRWTTASGATPVSHLLGLQEVDGSFRWTGKSISGPAWMTAYAIPALVGKPLPVAPP